MATKKYTSDHIETLTFPDSVRKNASQYIGGIDSQGVWNVCRELLDNAVDEALAGRNSAVLLFLDKDGSYWVQDKGPGIPQGIKTQVVEVSGKKVKSQMPTMQAVFGALHTSGKYRDEAYKVSIGTHGIGAKGTNATAEFFEVWTCYDDKWSSIKFAKGELVQGVQSCKPPKGPMGPVKEGTLIHFRPDKSIFSTVKFPITMALEWASIMSYMNPGFRIVVAKPGAKPKVFLSKLGVKDYIKDRLTERKVEAEADIFEFHSGLADVVVAFSNLDDCDLRGFTNGLHNVQGGYHVDSVSKALFNAVAPYRNKKHTFTRREFDEGLLGIVNAKLHKASFSSQDKAKLTDVRMAAEFEKEVTDAAIAFFKKNKALAGRLCDKANKISELKQKFKASKAVATALNSVKRNGLPPNYAPASRSTKIPDRELFIVEGDSAAGGFRKVRKAHQALLPLHDLLRHGPVLFPPHGWRLKYGDCCDAQI
jgi:DNA gyrase/topoisomerase IV subunit B